MTDAPAQAPADPGTIDLDGLKKQCKSVRMAMRAPIMTVEVSRMEDIIAAVEALRKLAIDDQSGDSWRAIALKGEFQAGEVDRIASEYLRRAEAAEVRVAELEPIVKDGVRRAENCMNWQSYAVELTEALEKAIQLLDEGMGLKAYKLIKETAVATPEEVMERARALEACAKMLRQIADYYIEPDSEVGACVTLQAMAEEPLEALARLDALKEKPKP